MYGRRTAGELAAGVMTGPGASRCRDAKDQVAGWRDLCYIPAQKLYFAAARPADNADIIVHNDEPRRPAWQVRPH
jgi:uridine kinase